MSLFDEFVNQFSQHQPSRHYRGSVNRLVETQEFAATTNLVDDLDEQFVLEQMLDEVKPRYRPNTESMHYLLKTPFRYPPLKHGSRFGSRLMASFFYASEQVSTTLAEVAYYRFVFLTDMQTPYEGVIQSEHLMFWVDVESAHCTDLTDSCFAAFDVALTDPGQYGFCQQVGRWLVDEQQQHMIRYRSARNSEGTNVAVYRPQVIQSQAPYNQQNWLCLTSKNQISFSQHGGHPPVKFHFQDFSVNGRLPRPA